MAARAVLHFVDWVLRLDASGSSPIFEAECTTCQESSVAADGKEQPEVWCLRHAGRSVRNSSRTL
jgi:hypothetical protein